MGARRAGVSGPLLPPIAWSLKLAVTCSHYQFVTATPQHHSLYWDRVEVHFWTFGCIEQRIDKLKGLDWELGMGDIIIISALLD